MTRTHAVRLGTILLLSLLATDAVAQHGPWVEATREPIIDLVEPARSQSAVQPQPATQQAEQVTQNNSESKPLGLPRQTESKSLGGESVKTPVVLGKEFVRTLAALTGVLLLIFAVAQVYKRYARSRGGLSGQIGAGGRAPAGLVEVLARYPISSGMTIVVLRFDRKVLLLSHANARRSKRGGGSNEMQTLCEVNSPEDVASILGKVRDASGDSIAASFERTLQEAGNATDQEIQEAMYQPAPGLHVQRPRRIAPGMVSNDEGDRLELTSAEDSSAASQVLRRRLGAMRRGR
jgi:flagellar biogenesis protein FliO